MTLYRSTFAFILLWVLLLTDLKSQDFVFTQEKMGMDLFANGNALTQDNSGRVFTAFDYGHFYIRDNGIWQYYRIPGSSANDLEYSIQAIEPDDNGGVWLGTFGQGLFHFDGVSYTQYTTDNSDIPGNIITNILKSNGNLWMSVRNFGLSYKEGDTYTNISTTSGAPFGNDQDPSEFVVLQDGTLVVGTGTKLVFRSNDGSYQSISLPPDYTFLASITDMYLTPAGDIWLSLWRGGLALYTNGEIIGYQNLTDPILNLDHLVAMPNGDIWASTTSSDIYIFRDLCFKSIERPTNLFVEDLSIIDNKAAAVSSTDTEYLTYMEIGDFQNSPCELPTIVTNNARSGIGSLSHAIKLSNLYPGPDTITFNIPTGQSTTISLAATLPDITDTLVIDGTTQPGYNTFPIISLVSSSIHAHSAIEVLSSEVEIHGLQFHNFSSAIYSPDNVNGNLIIGKAHDGNYFKNNRYGIRLTSRNLSTQFYGNTFTRTFYTGIYAIETKGSRNIVGGIEEGEGNIFINYESVGYLGYTGISRDQFRGNTISCATNELNYVPVSSWRTPIPIISSVSGDLIIGTAVGNCIIDVYVDDDCNTECIGGSYIGTTESDGSGSWQISDFDLSSYPEHVRITAIATLPETTGSSKFAICVEYEQVSGCTDTQAHNYNPEAELDNGSCLTCSDGIQNGDETAIDCGGVLCEPCTDCDGINVTLNNIPITEDVFMEDYIISSSTLAPQQNVSFRAGNYIQLTPGLHINTGSTFRAYIGQCMMPPSLTTASEKSIIDQKKNIDPLKGRLTTAEGIFMKAYPNPVQDILYIDYALFDKSKATVQLINIAGRVVKEEVIYDVTNQINLNTTTLPSGIYFLRLVTNDNQLTQRISIIRN